MADHEFTRDEINRMPDPSKTTLTDLFYNGHVFDVDHPLFDGLVVAEPFSSKVWIATIRRVKKQRDDIARMLYSKIAWPIRYGELREIFERHPWLRAVIEQEEPAGDDNGNNL